MIPAVQLRKGNVVSDPNTGCVYKVASVKKQKDGRILLSYEVQTVNGLKQGRLVSSDEQIRALARKARKDERA